MKQATVFIQGEKTIPIRNNEKLIKNYSGIPFLLTIALLILIGCTKPGIDDGPGATLARVTIVSANTINQTTAQSGGNITSDGDSPITARGVCWSTTNNPTISNSKTNDGTGAGSFTSAINGLTANTKYYIRAYATNSAGTAYSNEESFTTQQAGTMATLTTTQVNIITQTTAQSGGNITSDGGAPITDRGICWSTTTAPTVADSKTLAGTGAGDYTSFLTGMSANTVYYVRAYATNSAGTAYGNEITFTTQPISANTVTDIDGNVYNTVTIGTQVWMVENLKTKHYANGDAIPTGLNDPTWGTATSGAYAIYGDYSANNEVFGKLYNWFAVVDPRNIAPAGWHVPTEAEWVTLTSFLGGSTIAGGSMKEAGLTHWNSPNTGATNSSGFTGLPGGSRSEIHAYEAMGNAGYWWSTTEAFGGADAQAMGLFTNSDEANIVTGSKIFGTSIRCIKD
jgi:uncharacterized protein (TIGR02145 family)